ncbi:MAG: carbohydrate ABC transporter substrate-binding protein [Alphaproteobacteria bacterium]|nr:carbohydrate ABC transporter substrate-binding protein [Alphaproteobacteria bacterium]
MTRNLSRRSTLALGAGLAAVSALPGAAFGQAAKRLRMTWWGGTERAKRTQDALQVYQKKNPGVQIDTETVGWGDYWTKLATQVAGGNAPDVIQMDYRYIFEYARRRSLKPLDEFMPNPLDIADFGAANIDGGRVDGKVFGVSMGVNSTCIFHNRTVLERLKINPPDLTTTWPQFAEIATAIAKAEGRRGFFGSTNAGFNEPALEVWVRQRGKALYTDEGKLAFARDDIAEWFDYWDQMRQKGGAVVGEIQALNRQTTETDMLSMGRAAITFAHSNQLVAWQAINKDKLGMTAIPGAKPGQYYKPSMLLSVSATTPQGQEAARIVNFISTDPDAGAVLGVERGVPPSKRMRDALLPKVDELGRAQIEYISAIANNVSKLPPPPPKGAGEIEQLLKRVYETVSLGTAKVPDAATTFMTEAQKALERA